MNLNNDLFIEKNYINNEWVDLDEHECISILDPCTGNVIGKVPNINIDQVKYALSCADKALKGWKSKTGKERSIILRRWYDLIIENKDDLALIITKENGKPLKEAEGEVLYGASFVEWFSEEAKRSYGHVIPQTQHDQRLLVIKQPVGVCAAITAWNFPCTLITRKVAPALAAGCTIVVRPADQTPFSALALAKLAQQAGIPKGVFNVITGDAEVIGREFTENHIVKKITFTGSTRVGRLLMKQASSSIKRLSLELGGNAPFIVFEDADISLAINSLIQSKFRNAGQTCVCANRVFVHNSIYDNFKDKLIDSVSQLKVGNGLDPDVDIGPMIDESSINKINDLINDAVDKGAEILLGGGLSSIGKNFYKPTILSDIKGNMKISGEEIFGPIIPLYKFKDENDVVDMANNVDVGLAGYFFTKNVSRVWQVAEDLEVGMVAINTGIFSNEVGPFGGIKQSGYGREGSFLGLDDYTQTKYICIGDITPDSI